MLSMRAAIVLLVLSLGAGPAAAGDAWYFGDFHEHVCPPDIPGDVFASIDRIKRDARREGLDFVVLSPHVWPVRERGERDLQAIERWARDPASFDAGPGRPLVLVPGIEHTRTVPGHLGVTFIGADALAAEVSDREAGRPLPLRLIDRGALVFLNHPLGLPSRVPKLITDRINPSWKPFARPELMRDPALSAEAEEILSRVAGFEVLNRAIAQAERLFGTPREETHLDKAFRLLDREILRQRRRLVGIGGSDNHAVFVAGATWIEARELSVAALREGVLAGRVVVGGRAATALRAVSDEVAEPQGVGASLAAARWVELRFPGAALVWRDGEFVGERRDVYRDESVRAGELHVYRIAIGDSWSNPVYANLREPAAPVPVHVPVAQPGPAPDSDARGAGLR